MSTEIPVDFTRLHFGQYVIATIFAGGGGNLFHILYCSRKQEETQTRWELD